MSLSFSINNAGPLSQVGIEICSIQTAVELAIGAYGWFKATERSKSLTQILSVSGGELVSTSSFNYNFYKDLRTQQGIMQGVVVQNGVMQRTQLPKASTAVPDHSGIACLRALTAGILCLYEPDTVVAILQDLIPYALVQLHQEDAVLEMEGPLLTSLKQWVSTVASEEDGNTFRNYLLREAATQESRLTGAPLNEIMEADWTDTDETTYIIGVLRWILTPLNKRELRQYPTRSLRVWNTASIMAKLGFDVYAAPAVVRTDDEYNRVMNTSIPFGQSPDVFLVVTTGAETDPMMLNETPLSNGSSLRPQVTVVRCIPWLAFRHLRGDSGSVDTQFLTDVWNYSFRSTRKCFKGLHLRNMQVKVDIAGHEAEAVLEFHKSLLSEFSPLLYRICGPAMHQFIPNSPLNPGWNQRKIMDRIRILRSGEELFEKHELEEQAVIRDNCYILLAIILGAIYGLCSQACIDDGKALSEDSEMAFIPDLVFQGGSNLKRWAKSIGLALTGALGYDQWAYLLFELFLAVSKPVDGRQPLNSNSSKAHDNGRRILGAQANGITAVSDLVVSLSIQPKALFYYHIGRGQILNLPLTEDGYIEASSCLTTPMILQMNPDPQNSSLHRFEAREYVDSLRIDIEPCWEDDPRTVIFRVREMGRVIAPINIRKVVESVAYKSVHCACSKHTDTAIVPITERWQHLSMQQLKRTRFKGESLHRADVDVENSKVLVDASRSETTTIYAIGILHTRHLAIAMECLACAYKNAIQNIQQDNTSVAVVIPWKEL
jgi:hypothetical protein